MHAPDTRQPSAAISVTARSLMKQWCRSPPSTANRRVSTIRRWCRPGRTPRRSGLDIGRGALVAAEIHQDVCRRGVDSSPRGGPRGCEARKPRTGGRTQTTKPKASRPNSVKQRFGHNTELADTHALFRGLAFTAGFHLQSVELDFLWWR